MLERKSVLGLAQLVRIIEALFCLPQLVRIIET